MSFRRLSFYLSLAFLAVVLIGLPIRSQNVETTAGGTQSIIAGRNVNMVSGTTLPGGDPWLQRQNEPSIAVSTRNPLHLLAGANDYRTVDIPFSEGELPGKAQGAMAGDAWVGVYKSFDGGESWVTSLIYGFPQDQSPQGLASPLKQFSTAADPIVRAGTNGLFYYSGMAFNRAQAKGGGSIFLTRFIDNNNVENIAGDPIKYLDTKVIDQGTSGQFIDMPRIAVDIPRGTGNVTIDGQSIPKSNIYCAYTVFLGNTGKNIRSRIMFRRSTDCGATWGSAIKISEGQHIIQGATIAIDPASGAVYVAFRRFLHPSQTNSIAIVKSMDFGQSFSKPTVIAEINPFDQPATDALGDDISDPAGPSFRTNSYPTMTVDKDGIVYVAWTERGRGPTGEARIVMSTSQGGGGWTQPTAIVNMADPTYQGHQFMPHLIYAQGRLVLVWYDQRYDEYAPLYGVGSWIGDNMPIRHTTDVRCAQANPGLSPSFQESVQVSKYLWALAPGSSSLLEQEQYNPPNFEMFKGGTTPFHGDYIEVTPSPQFVLGANGWKFNTEKSNAPVFHVVWTDNRDVRPPANGDWANYTPPSSNQPGFGSVECGNTHPSTMGMRNQNIYTSTLVQGIAAASPSNTKTLGNLGTYYDSGDGLIPRAFVIYVKNPGSEIRTFRLTIEPEPADVDASFAEFEDLDVLDAMIAPYSTIARTVFVRSSEAYASVQVGVEEIDELGGTPVPNGLTASVTLNPDPTSPSYSPPEEYHNPNIRNLNIVNWDELNHNIVNPNIRNPNIRNWDLINSDIVNPNIRNTNYVNPNIRNDNVANPNIRNWNIVNPNIRNVNLEEYDESEFKGAKISDAVFTIKNEGNTTSTYTLKTYSKESLPEGVYAQLLIYRVHYTPSGDYYEQTENPCELREERHHELLLNVSNPNIRNSNIVNPNIRNPNIRNGGLENATFAVPPGEEVEAILRVIDFAPSAQGQFRVMQSGAAFNVQEFIESIGFAATSHAYDTEVAGTTPREELSYTSSATKLVISTSSLPDGVVGAPYSAALMADGGTAPYTWTLNSGALPDGLSLGYGGVISGTPTAAGIYHFIIRVDDSTGDFDTQELSLFIDDDGQADPLAITTTYLPSGVLYNWYGAKLEATGGVWPRTWSLASGSLPPGLGLDSDGVISGTIEKEPYVDPPKTYSFSVVVTDGAGTSSPSKALSITVNLSTGNYLTISGMVYDENGDPLNGVVMRGLPNTPISGANGTPGSYEDELPEFWSGTVTPFLGEYAFSPASRTYSVLGSAQSNQDYSVGAGGSASQLAFSQQPGSAIAGGTIMPAVTVEIQDVAGNLATTATNTVTLSLDANPGEAVLTGTTSKEAVAGIATFNDLSLDQNGTGYTLTAASSGLAGATSSPFDIVTAGTDQASAPLIPPGIYEDYFPPLSTGEEWVPHWFKVAVEEGQDIRVSTSDAESPSGYNTDLEASIYDGTGRLLVIVYSNRSDETVYLSNVPAGMYYIVIWGPPDVRYTLTIAAGDLTGIGEITGRITNSRGEGVGNLFIEAYLENDYSAAGLQQVAVTDLNGDYKIAFTPGNFKLNITFNEYFVVPSDPYVLFQWYQGKTDFASADVVSIIADETNGGNDDQLADGGAISGRVTSATGEPVVQTLITAYNPDGSRNPGYDRPDNPDYLVGHIRIPAEGNVKLRFSGSGVSGGYIVTWYNGKYSLEAADLIPVQPRETTQGIDAQLLTYNGGGYIQGRVTDGEGNGIPDFTVKAYDFAQGEVGSTSTGSTGYYTLSGLPTFPARIYFDASQSTYASQWYNGKGSFATADIVNAVYGTAVTGIDAVLGLAGSETIQVSSPNGGEGWTVGSTQNITWTSSGVIDNVQIEVSTNGGADYSDILASTANTGSYSWVIPDSPSTNCLVRISEAVTGTPADVSDAVFSIVAPALLPEINIKQGGIDLNDGGSYDFGSAAVGSNTYALFTIENLGAAQLTITTPITITGTNSDEFHVETQPSSPVASGGSTTLELRFSPTSEGAKSASIAIGNNDSDENPYDITLNGTGSVFPPDQFTKVLSGAVVTDGADSTGCAWGDYDNDGDLDLFVSVGSNQNNLLYANNGDGSFTKVTSSAIVENVGYSGGCAWGDYDNDGELDLFVANVGYNNSLYTNNGDGSFTKVTSGAVVEDWGNSYGCAWGDYDNDGGLDLFVANAYSQNNFLHANNGDGSFTQVTSGAIVEDGGRSRDCAWGDYDNDGDLDLFVANENGQNNFLYANNGDGSFTKVTSGAVVTDGGYSYGCAWGDYDNDGELDLFVANFGQNNFLYTNNGDGSFTKVTSGAVVEDVGNSYGCAWGDYDNDGDLDLFVANIINENNFLYTNNGDGSFTKVTSGVAVTDGGSSDDCAWGDYDNDGDLDLFVSNGHGLSNDFLYANNGNGSTWINIKCIGTASNVSAIGTKVKVLAMISGSPVWQLREISGGASSQDSLNAEFGLGDAAIVDEIRIEWPSGNVQTLTSIAVNQFLTVTETETSGVPAKLAFVQQPSDTAVGATITPPVTVEIQDAAGNLVTTATNTMTLSLRNAGSAALSGDVDKEAVGGVATFDDLSIDTIGTGYQLRANSGSLTEVDSNPFNITGAEATHIIVETAADGSGTEVPAQSMGAGSSITVYAIARDATTIFIENVAADSWSLINKTGGVVDGDLVPSGDMKSATFTGHSSGTAQIHAEKVGFSSTDSGVLTVIPLIHWHTYAGSSVDDQSFGIAMDPSGNIYFTGWSDGTWGNPINPHSGGRDVFVAKLSSTGELQWNTFLGSSDTDEGNAIAVDGNGNVYAMGTSSATWGQPLNSYGGQGDAFVAKLNSSGNLLWNLFIGGEWGEHGDDIAVDASGNVYATGVCVNSWSDGFWGTPINLPGCCQNVFVVKLNSSGTVQWYTFIGADGGELGTGIGVDASGHVYVSGWGDRTWGTPVNDHTGDGSQDGFVAKLDSSGNPEWHTFFGGAGQDEANAIAVDTSGNLFISGHSTASWGTPINPHSGGEWDAFVVKLDSSGVRQWHTFMEGLGWDIAVDGGQNVYVTGVGGGHPGYVAALNQDGILQWNISLEGCLESIALDESHNFYVAGRSSSSWGTPVNAWAGGWDAFVAKIGPTI
ncbi:MAG: FG-GAP-like repeat-containing protein [Candidatus Aminicenantales bacterium]